MSVSKLIVWSVFLFLIVVTSANSLKAQCLYSNPTQSLGIGLVEYDNYNHKTPILKVYNDSQLQQLFCSWNLYEDENPPFCAKFHKPDYGKAQMIVLEIATSFYKVLINQNDIKYIPKTIDYVFWSWKEYLLESHGIRRKIENLNLKNQPIRTAPSDASPSIKIPNEQFELFCIQEVKGDWVRIKYDCFYNQSENPNEGMPCSTYIGDCNNSVIGWLRWRDGNEILVDIFTMA